MNERLKNINVVRK